MCSFIKTIFSMRFSDAKKGGWPGTPMSQPLKYRESNYTLAELERRLNADVNGFGTRY
jgi:hypothetical protein|tara:strand:- start:1218 stop:1391 length:174 start_codon:yes stop_codon:yes gene_type:complete